MAPMAENAAGGGNTQGTGGEGGGGEPDEKLVNAIISKLDLDRKIGGAVANQLKKLDLSKPIAEAFAAYETKRAEDEKAKGGKGEGDDASTKKVDPKLLELERKVAQQDKEIAKEREARVAAETKSRNDTALSQLRTAYSKAGVRAEVIETLVKAARADITFDEQTGEPLLPVKDGTSTIEAAVEEWAKSKEADAFKPAPNTGGAGSARTNGKGAEKKPYAQMSREEKLDALAQMQGSGTVPVL